MNFTPTLGRPISQGLFEEGTSKTLPTPPTVAKTSPALSAFQALLEAAGASPDGSASETVGTPTHATARLPVGPRPMLPMLPTTTTAPSPTKSARGALPVRASSSSPLKHADPSPGAIAATFAPVADNVLRARVSLDVNDGPAADDADSGLAPAEGFPLSAEPRPPRAEPESASPASDPFQPDASRVAAAASSEASASDDALPATNGLLSPRPLVGSQEQAVATSGETTLDHDQASAAPSDPVRAIAPSSLAREPDPRSAISGVLVPTPAPASSSVATVSPSSPTVADATPRPPPSSSNDPRGYGITTKSPPARPDVALPALTAPLPKSTGENGLSTNDAASVADSKATEDTVVEAANPLRSTRAYPHATLSAERGHEARANPGSATRDSAPGLGAEVAAKGQGATPIADLATPASQASSVPALPSETLAASSDNALTPVAPSGVETMTPGSPNASAPVATLSAANLSVIHQAAHGEIVVPDLGRVSVTARAGDGGVDLRVTTGKASATEQLLPHAVAMAADIRSVNLPLQRLEISNEPLAGRDPPPGATPQGDAPGSNGSGESPSSRNNRAPRDPSSKPENAPPRGRVRIVL